MKRIQLIVALALGLAGLVAAARPTWAAAAAETGAAPRTSAPSQPGAGPRRLEDIHIEGQMPAPQVLFITARDQRRFLDFQHARYLRSAREIGEEVRMPRRFVVSAHGTARTPEAP